MRAHAPHITRLVTRAVPEENASAPVLSVPRIVVGLLLTLVVVLVAVTVAGRSGSGGSASPSRDDGTYLVRSGDTTASVAELHGVSVDELMEVNGLTLSDSLDPGSRMVIPEVSTEGRSPPHELTGDSRKLTYEPLFDRATEEHGLPPGLLEALAWHESEWVNAHLDESERTGLGQLRPEIVDFLRRDVVAVPLDPRRPEDNVELTAAYLAHLLAVGEGDQAAALAGYYLGLETPAGGTFDLDVVRFVREVLRLAPDFAGSVAPTPPSGPATTGP